MNNDDIKKLVKGLRDATDAFWAHTRSARLLEAAAALEAMAANRDLWRDKCVLMEAERDRLKTTLDQAGDAICEVFEQMLKGNWQDDNGHLVEHCMAVRKLEAVFEILVERKAIEGDVS